jgi:hypothetical protein
MLDYFSGVGWSWGWVGEPGMVCDAHLFLLQFHTGSFVAADVEKGRCRFQCGTA